MIFEVTPEHVARLSDEDLRSLVGRLCEGEMVARGWSTAGVTYGGHQDAADGGIDVRVEAPSSIEGYVPRSATGFQVKAADMPKAAIGREMRPGGLLRPAIAELAARDGAYVMVSSKESLTDKRLLARREAMRSALRGCPDAQRLHVDFYDRQRLASWINRHPGAIAWVRIQVGEPLQGWHPWGDWSSSPLPPGAAYFLDEEIRLVPGGAGGGTALAATAGIEAIRATLSEPHGVVRLVGLSGVGKTRLVQALFDPAVGANALPQGWAIYADTSEMPDPSPLGLLDRLEAIGRACTVVIDNCAAGLHDSLTRRMKGMRAPIGLLTVEYDIQDDEPESTQVWHLEPASGTILARILERHHPTLSPPDIERIAEFSDGNARIALVLANTARHGASLATLNDEQLFERLFVQRKGPDTELLKAAKVISLVYSFDGDMLEGDDAELPVLARLACIPVETLYGHVEELYRRKLVQKRSRSRAFLPHALAHRLARRALADIPPATLRAAMEDAAPPRILRSFSRRLGDLHDSPRAQAIVARWLGPGGVVEKLERLGDCGLALLENVAPVKPEEVLAAIERAVLHDLPGVMASSIRARTATRLLRSLAYEPASFDQAALLIARLAGDGTRSSDLSAPIRIFEALFHPALSGTDAGPAQRAELLGRMAEWHSDHVRRLVLLGLEAMVAVGPFASFHAFGFGTRRRGFGYQPCTPEEREDWNAAVLRLCGHLATLPSYREHVRDAVGRGFAVMAHAPGSTAGLALLVRTLASGGGWPQGHGHVVAAVQALEQAGRAGDAAPLAELVEVLRPRSLRDRIAVAVLSRQEFDREIEREGATAAGISRVMARHAERCRNLARELASDPAMLLEHLGILAGAAEPSARDMASELGRLVGDARGVWSAIVAEVTNDPTRWASSTLPGWFLHGLASRDPDLVQEMLDDAMEREAFHPLFVQMEVAVGFGGGAADRLARVARMTSVPVGGFIRLGYDRSEAELGSLAAREILAALVGREGGLAIALDIFRMRLQWSQDRGLTIDAQDRQTGASLLERAFLDGVPDASCVSLEELVSSCLIPGRDNGAAERMLRGFRNAVVAGRMHVGKCADAMEAFAKLFPQEVLDALVEVPDGVWNTLLALRSRWEDGRGILHGIKPSVIVSWMERDPGPRSIALAGLVQVWTRPDGDQNVAENAPASSLTWSPAARALIDAAPDRVAVLQRLRGRFVPTVSMGSRADILEGRMPLLDELGDHPDPLVVAWAAAEKGNLATEVAGMRAFEAELNRSPEESFEPVR